MRQIDLLWLRVENFASFHAPVTFRPSLTPGLKFLGGLNDEEPRLGANGAGKSSLWNALVWCLFGTTARGSKTSDVLNWDAKQVEVTVCLQMEGEEVEITRRGPPNKTFLGAEPVEQSEINAIVGLTRLRFLHSVVFGQAAPLFIDLPIPARGDLLEEILDLGLWGTLSDRAAAYSATLTQELRQAQQDLAHVKGKLAGFEDETQLAAQAATWTADKEAELDKWLLEFERMEQSATLQQTQGLQKQVETAEQELQLSDQHTNRTTAALATITADLRHLNAQRGDLAAQVSFYRDNKLCPTCGQTVTPQHAQKHTKELRELETQLSSQSERLGASRQAEEAGLRVNAVARKQLSDDLKELQRSLAEKNYQNRKMQEELDALEQRVKDAAKQRDSNPFTARLLVVRQGRAEAISAQSKLTGMLQVLQGRINVADFWRQGFKRVRLYLIKQALSALEIEVNSAASTLGLVGWHIAFKTETETKSGTLKLGIQVEVTTRDTTAPWESWSGGEAQRIRLAVAIGLSNMIQRMSGVYWTTEVYDEPSAWLSPEGIEDLLECLDYRANVTKRSVWVLDHRALTYAGFAEHWEVRKAMTTGSTIHQLGAVA